MPTASAEDEVLGKRDLYLSMPVFGKKGEVENILDLLLCKAIPLVKLAEILR